MKWPREKVEKKKEQLEYYISRQSRSVGTLCPPNSIYGFAGTSQFEQQATFAFYHSAYFPLCIIVFFSR